MAVVTYTNESPSSIREGDTVSIKGGETFTAYSDAQWVSSENAYNILTERGTWKSLDSTTLVSLTYTEDDEYAYA